MNIEMWKVCISTKHTTQQHQIYGFCGSTGWNERSFRLDFIVRCAQKHPQIYIKCKHFMNFFHLHTIFLSSFTPSLSSNTLSFSYNCDSTIFCRWRVVCYRTIQISSRFVVQHEHDDVVRHIFPQFTLLLHPFESVEQRMKWVRSDSQQNCSSVLSSHFNGWG